MARVTPQQAAEKWSRRLGASGQDIQTGVQQVTQSPMQLAAANQQGYIMGVQEAVNSGKWQAGLQRVSLPQWQQAMIQKGIPRIASGAQQGIPKMQEFMTQFLPYLDQGVAQVRQMPKTSVQDGIARATAMILHNAAFRRR